MSKFDKFGGRPPSLPSAGRQSSLPVSTSGKPNSLVERARANAAAEVAQQAASRSRPARFAIALDATGSMSGLIGDAKASISEIIRRLTREAGQPIEIQIFAYRDYDCGPSVLEVSELTGDANELIRWLSTVQATGGGGNEGEAVETALDKILHAGDFRAVVVAGDEPPNQRVSLEAAGKMQGRVASEIARDLGRARTPVHTFVVANDPRTVAAFHELSTVSGGKSGRLDGSSAMIDMAVMAMLAALKGMAGVRAYATGNPLSPNAKAFATLLLGGPSK